MPNTISVLDSTSTTVTIHTAFDQSTPVAGAQMGLSVSGLTSLTVPGTATTALIQIEGPNVRWRDDGPSPTTTVGFLLYGGGAPQVFAGNLAAASFIGVSGSPTMNVLYYK